MSLKSNLKLISPLGSGHFGQVYLGNDPVHGQVAVKVLSRQQNEPALNWLNRKQELLKEGERLARAKHPHVVQVHHLVESVNDDAVLIVMELCSGSLQSAYDVGPMTLKQTRDHASDISLGLEALHARDMLHRDIKPGNILIDNRGRAKIGDFGLVTDDLVLGYGSINGYSDHVAIEVYQGNGTSVRSDIWALGMTIYRMLHGSQWYSRSPSPRFLIEKGNFAKGLRWLPHIPQAWQRFVRKCMSDDPASRYQTMQQINAALAALPIDPSWECTISGKDINWSRVEGTRRHRAIWTENSSRSHEWSAWSEPLGEGITRKKGSSDGAVSQSTCLKGLASVLK